MRLGSASTGGRSGRSERVAEETAACEASEFGPWKSDLRVGFFGGRSGGRGGGSEGRAGGSVGALGASSCWVARVSWLEEVWEVTPLQGDKI